MVSTTQHRPPGAGHGAGEYRVSTLGATLDEVGFIHGTFRQQVERIGSIHYALTMPAQEVPIGQHACGFAAIDKRLDPRPHGRVREPAR